MTRQKEHDKLIYVLNRYKGDKSARDRLSGILRYGGNHSDWRLRLIEAKSAKAVLQTLLADRPDGIICNLILDSRPLEPLGKTPVVTLDAYQTLRNHAAVCIDDAAIARAACTILHQRKFNHLIYVGAHDPIHSVHNSERADEARRCASEFGMTFDTFSVSLGPHNLPWLGKLADWLAKLALPCGIMAFSDETSRMILDSARLANIDVPGKLAIIGVDNDPWICECLRPTLSSVLPDFEHGGYLASQLLDHLLQGGKPPSSALVYGVRNVIERESTQDIRGSGRLVSLAQQMIRQQGLSGLSLSDVSAKLNVSPRLLESHFKSILGRSMRTEQTKLRMLQAMELLSKTSKPLYEIANLCGAQRFASFAALFKRQTGMTMSSYRTTVHQPDSAQ